MGEVLEAMTQIDGRYTLHGPSLSVVHLAAIPMPGFAPNSPTMQNNTMSTYNVFEACRRLGVKNVVWASSETLIGLPLVSQFALL